MTDTPKRLGAVAPADTLVTDLYTVPALTKAVMSSLVVCNLTTSPQTFRIIFLGNGETLGNKNYLYYDVTIPANDVFIATIGITSGVAGDKIQVKSGAANALAFNLFGDEIT